MIGRNPEKISRDFRRIIIIQTPVKKTPKGVIINYAKKSHFHTK